ncbi:MULTISPECIES: hypothetical protein [Vibrio]|uniref:hypothetical protein n=1 Tax=Vibrio TaxID=662 RepID=UPI0003647EC1|nr:MULTISPECIES: hypothetical protein [Vibrio]OEF92895.1 hypothetical protein A162_06145 [Vibrio tasmaniensis 1F-155]TCT78544.1 hypothetical protein EDB46_101102 [Vibrio crassostreae]CDT35417.1 hypothetical protein VCR20J5_220086 [Vibrio crassostreae]CDT47937.1 hypothetical protein VCRLGP8_370237 [Vibrio crassostreae]CDT90382.1 hypothetical protein VCR29J2_760016 [Vibrio coralliirubri]
MKKEINKFELSTNRTITEIHQHFIKANNDQSLNTMFDGLQKKLGKIDCSEKERVFLFNNIYIAYGRRQEDFDGRGKTFESHSSSRIESIMKNQSNLSPEDLLGEALRALE